MLPAEIRKLDIVSTLFKRQGDYAKWLGINHSSLVRIKQKGIASEPNAKRVRVMLEKGFGDLPGQISQKALKAAHQVYTAQQQTQVFGTLEADVISRGKEVAL